jgi:hypothetical protein
LAVGSESTFTNTPAETATTLTVSVKTEKGEEVLPTPDAIATDEPLPTGLCAIILDNTLLSIYQ